MNSAIWFHGNGRAKLEPVQAPVHPAPGHVLGRTLYSLTRAGTVGFLAAILFDWTLLEVDEG